MFKEKLVHLDLKGGPPRPDYLVSLFPLMQAWGATGLCIEWEDMLPFHGRLAVIRSPHAYTAEEVRQILDAAHAAGLTVVPLVQTYGHLEYLLKHEAFAGFREDPDAMADLRPTHPEAVGLVKELVGQVIDLHPGIERIHLGGDEVRNLGSHPDTAAYLRENGRDRIYLMHMLPVIEYTRSRVDNVLIWDDMLRTWPVSSLKELAGKAAPVVWRYGPDIDKGMPADMWERYAAAGLKVWCASAFKGSGSPDAIWGDFENRALNHAAWSARAEQNRLEGIILTGWSRHNHFGTLSQLLPAGLPGLALSLKVLEKGTFNDAMRKKVFTGLGIGDMPFMHSRTEDMLNMPTGTFPGADLFRLIGKLQSARQLMWFVNEELVFNFPDRNGGRVDLGRARQVIRKSTWAAQIAAEVREELVPALHRVLLKPDADEFIDVQIDQLIAFARTAIAKAEAYIRVLQE